MADLQRMLDLPLEVAGNVIAVGDVSDASQRCRLGILCTEGWQPAGMQINRLQ